MLWRKLRTIALIALCGGMMFQAAAGCDTFIAPIVSTIVSSVVSGVVGNLFLAT